MNEVYRFRRKGAQLYIPDGATYEEAFNRTTHMGIGAHPDDLEISMFKGVAECFNDSKKWFFGVVVTEGGGSPRSGPYADIPDEDMKQIRVGEQKKAAYIGEYSGVALLDYPSNVVKDREKIKDVVEDLKNLTDSCRPPTIYAHALIDSHDTHVAVALRTIEALRELSEKVIPLNFYGCEGWRNLDWLVDGDKISFDVSGHDKLAKDLLDVFDSKIAGGKAYDIAVIGRRKANATFAESHKVDEASDLIHAMDLMPLIRDTSLDPEKYALEFIDRSKEETSKGMRKVI